MKVKIVDKKEDVKEMTIEELVKESFVGALSSTSGKYFLQRFRPGTWAWTSCNDLYCWANGEHATKQRAIECAFYHELHIFDSARKLYLWMAE